MKKIFDFSNEALYNTIYLPLLHDENRTHILYGGRDSGKSDFIAQATIIDMLQQEYFKMILLRKHHVSVKESQYETILEYLRMWGLMEHFHLTALPLTITCKLNYNQILARGLDKPDNTKSIKDPTAIWYEEADQISYTAYQESSNSLRTSREARLREYISFNPRNESSWINKFFFPEKQTYEREDGRFHFVKSTAPDTTILHTNFMDNEFIRVKRVQKLISSKDIDENYYKVNALGLWGGALRGLIYPNWNAVDEFPNAGDDIFALDYGFNNPTAFVHLNYYEKELFVKEIFYKTELTHPEVVEHCNYFRDMIGKKLIVVDSAAPELVRLLRKSGFNAIGAIKGPGSVYSGILLTKLFKMNIVSGSPNVVDEIRSYTWKVDRDDTIYDEPVMIDDHAMDAIRYGVQTYGKKYWTPQKNVTEAPRQARRSRRDKFSGY